MCTAPNCDKPIGRNRRLYCDETPGACKCRVHRLKKSRNVATLHETLNNLTGTLAHLTAEISKMNLAPSNITPQTQQMALPFASPMRPLIDEPDSDLIEITESKSTVNAAENFMRSALSLCPEMQKNGDSPLKAGESLTIKFDSPAFEDEEFDFS